MVGWKPTRIRRRWRAQRDAGWTPRPTRRAYAEDAERRRRCPPAHRRLAADKLDAQRDVDLDALHGLQDVAVEHDVGRTSEADDQPLAEVVVEERLAGGEAAVDPERMPHEPPSGHGAADDVKESTLAVAEVGRLEAECDALDGAGEEEREEAEGQR